MIGQSIPRLEDRPLLRGEGRFAADINLPGQLHMRVVRAPVAFGRLLGIDAEMARTMKGVVAIWTADDIVALPQIDFRMTRIQGLGPYRQWVLARDYVRYVGEPVAVVFATDPYLAEDAADAVFCDIDEIDAHLDPLAEPVLVMPQTQPGLFSEPAVIRKHYGDLEAAFARAHRVVELSVKVGRHSGVPMETRGALAVYDEDSDLLTMYGAAKVPHYNRDAIARMLQRDPARVRLSEGHVGGGFGIRGELYSEDVLVCAAALKLRRPVKWIEDRREHMLCANHSRDQSYHLRAAVDERGFILGLDAEFFTDQGAYVRTHGGTVTDLSAGLLPGPYVIPAYRVAGHIRLTNKTPAGTYRAPGRYESTFARERLIDRIAAELGLDSVEVRRTNLVPEGAMPFDRGIEVLGTSVVLDSGRYHDLLDRLLAEVDYEALRGRIVTRRAAGETVGLGIGFFVEKSGLGPKDLARIRFRGDGRVEIVTGVASVGQGVETAMAQIAGEVLGCAADAVTVVHGQTDRIEYGLGAFASRVTVMTGSAVHLAACQLRESALDAASELLQTARAELVLQAGAIRAPGGVCMTLAQVAAHLERQGHTLEGEGEYASSHMNYPYGVHFAQVRIDRATAAVTIERYVVAYDVGRAVNPMLIEGQIVGAAAQGIGGALLEEFVYDAHGQPLATSFADYLMPTCSDVPEVETLLREDAPSPLNPLGVKGAGEGGATAVGAALASAIDDALGRPGAVDCLPVTPSRLHGLLRATTGSPGHG